MKEAVRRKLNLGFMEHGPLIERPLGANLTVDFMLELLGFYVCARMVLLNGNDDWGQTQVGLSFFFRYTFFYAQIEYFLS